jgi:hypothetical protein
MEINTHIHHSDMTSDMEKEAGEMTLQSNIYVDTRGATPKQKQAIKNVLDRHYKAIRSEIYAVERDV